MSLSVVVLAAGQGTRMKSARAKVVHELAGEPMICHVLAAAFQLAPTRIVLVVGHGAGQVRAVAGEGVDYVLQAEQLGTGHAVLQARELLAGAAETVMVLYGDTPLITSATLHRLVAHHEATRPALTALTCHMPDPTGYGRVLRDDAGRVLGVVEEAVATAEQRALTESNMGFYCFDDAWLWRHLERLPVSPQGEVYLTDLVEMAAHQGARVETVLAADPVEVQGINTRVQLAQAEARLRDRIRERLMLDGVTLIDPATTWIDARVQVGQDSVVYPNTTLKGQTVVGRECRLGPDTWIEDSTLGDRCQVRFSVLEGATLEDDVDAGPFAHLRQGAVLARGVHVGNFGEIKNSTLGPGTKMGHFGYLGDASVGERVNIGAGTVTCNFDGQRKHPTVIEDGAFIGSDSMLVAPVRIGAGAKTGAGSVVTRDVPPGSVAYGVPARVRDTQRPEGPEGTDGTDGPGGRDAPLGEKA